LRLGFLFEGGYSGRRRGNPITARVLQALIPLETTTEKRHHDIGAFKTLKKVRVLVERSKMRFQL
jgi:hypothetical protein